MAEVTVLTGSHLSDRRARIDDVIQQHWGRVVVLLPSHHLAQVRLDAFLSKTNAPGVLGNPFKTFDRLASDILEQEGDCAETLSDFHRGLLIQEVISDLREAGGLGTFDVACATPGFAAHALRIITQLKQAGVDHDDFAKVVAAREHPSGFDPIVSAVYKRYQEAVIATGVYDRVGVIWQAETLARDRSLKTLSETDMLVLDEFDDFTPSELRLVDALRAQVPNVVFGFAFNVNDPSQEDMYALPRASSDRVCRTFGVDFPEPCAESEPATVSMFVGQHLFWRSPPPSGPTTERNLSLVEYRDAWTEIEATGRTIKTLLLDGMAPELIAVLHRNISDAAAPLRSVFSEFGIPVTITATESLRETSVATFIVEVLDACDGWERDRIAGVLTSPWFGQATPEGFDSAATFLLARSAGVIQGHRDWSRGLESLQNRTDSSDSSAPLSKRLANPDEACTTLRAAIDRLFELMQHVPSRGSMSEYVDGVIHVMDSLQLEEILVALPDEIVELETAALERLRELLRKWQAWSHARESGSPIARAEFVGQLRRALRDTTSGVRPARGGIWCASMEDARHLSFEHVFLIAMDEGTVPRSAPINAIYGRADLDAFADQDIELDSHQRHTEREMLLLHRCMSSASKTLTVSWHAVDAGGKSRARSPFIADIESAAQGEIAIEPGESPYPIAERAASSRDLAASLPSHPSADIALDSGYVNRFNIGAEIERSRLDASPFALYDGVVRDSAVTDALHIRFGEAHTFSVNQFETYAGCPFRFFMDRVLAIPEDLPPDAAIDPRDRGQALHHILRAFHHHFAGKSAAEIPVDAMLGVLDGCIETVFDPLIQFGSPHARTLWRVERVRARRLLIRHLRKAAAKDDIEWKPEQFELSFGRKKPDVGESSEHLAAFVLQSSVGPIRFSGQIDRIDRAGDAVRIVDYKTSLHIKKQEALSGESLQLPIYGLAWDAMHEGEPCREASFVEIGSHKKVDAFTRADDDWDALADNVRTRVTELTQGIRGGHFPPDAQKGGCFGCSGRRACRYEQGRIERKQAAES